MELNSLLTERVFSPVLVSVDGIALKIQTKDGLVAAGNLYLSPVPKVVANGGCGLGE